MRVKICGITRLDDAKAACQNGAWALGFIQHPDSPRAMKADAVREILSELPVQHGIAFFGVFVNPSLEEAEEFILGSGINGVQLHGEESPDFCRQIREKFRKISLIKAFRPRAQEELKRLKEFAPLCDAFLIDAPPVSGDSRRGGTGRISNWKLARQAKIHGPVVLAGGLDSKNAREAFRAVEPFALDLSSGVELSPGIKSPQLLKELFETVKK